MFGKERCEMTKRTRGLINDITKKIFSDEEFDFNDVLGSDPRLLMLIGYYGQAMELAYDMTDDMYEHYESEKEINKKLLGELEVLNKKVSYNEVLIKDLEKAIKALNEAVRVLSKEDNKK